MKIAKLKKCKISESNKENNDEKSDKVTHNKNLELQHNKIYIVIQDKSDMDNTSMYLRTVYLLHFKLILLNSLLQNQIMVRREKIIEENAVFVIKKGICHVLAQIKLFNIHKKKK